MATYKEGTIAVTNGSKTVTGTNTLWQNYGIQQGDQLYLVDANELQTGSMYEVASVTDNTHLTLRQNYQGTTASGKSYAILNTAGNQTLPAVAARLANFMTDLNGVPSETAKGLVKLYSALGTNTDGALTQAAAKTALDGKAGLDSNAKVPIANLPVVGASAETSIFESGSNANGHYIKYADGTLIMFGYQESSEISLNNSGWGVTYSNNLIQTFPVAGTLSYPSVSVFVSAMSLCNVPSRSKTSFSIRVIDLKALQTVITFVMWIAVTRWK